MVDYTRYEFSERIKDLQEKLKNKKGWGQGYKSSTAQNLLEVIVDSTDHLHYMLERRVQEQFFPTAKLPSSIHALANSVGYRPRRKVSAKGEVLLVLKDPEGDGETIQFTELEYYDENLEEQRYIGSSDNAPDIEQDRIISCEVWNEDNVKKAKSVFTIPEQQRLEINGESFANKNPITFYEEDFYQIFEIAQGEIEGIEMDVSPGSEIYERNFISLTDYKDIDNDIFEIYDILQRYNDVRDANLRFDSIAFAGSEDRVYDVRITNDGLEVLFGDDNFGSKPDRDLIVRYLKTKGDEFDLQEDNLNVYLGFSIQDNKENFYDYKCNTITPITGGLPEESVNQIRQRAPEFIRSGNRAVTKSDYEYWAIQSGIGGIVDAKAYSEDENGLDVIQTNNIYITYINEDGRELRSKEVKRFQDFMDNYKIITTLVFPRLANFVDIKFNIRAKKREDVNLSNSEVFSQVKSFVEDYFKFEEGKIGKPFYLSEFTKHLEELETAQAGTLINLFKWVDVDFSICEEFEYLDSDFSKEIQLPLPYMPRVIENYEYGVTNNFSPSSFRLYKDDEDDLELIFEDNPDEEPLYTKGNFGDGNLVDYYFGTIEFNNLDEEGSYLIEYKQFEEKNVEINKTNILTFKPFNNYNLDESEIDPRKSTIEIL